MDRDNAKQSPLTMKLPLSRPAATRSPARSGGEGREWGRLTVQGFKARTLVGRILTPAHSPSEGEMENRRPADGASSALGNFIAQARLFPPHELRSSGRESAPSEIEEKSEPTHVGCYSSGVQSANFGWENSPPIERGESRREGIPFANLP